MGNLKLRFLSNGQNIAEPPHISNKVGQMQSLQRRYGTNKIEELEVEGDDFVLEIDTDILERDIEWEKLIYPNEIIKGKVLELIYYKEVSDKLSKILSEITSTYFDDRYNLARLGNEAIKIIENTKESKFFADLQLNKEDAIDDISHTLNKEVDILTTFIKQKDSQKRKNESLSEAKSYLSTNIYSFKLTLEHIEVNKNKE
ncbi:hypothetical protein ACD591_08035 [Rufibacter glacialis]|uniref:Uncharacterized protein n=1 Tax=Rufibacter glacialis TaxID=1259555 RepID=A0A5M8QTP7_9BACT|nr:hypothetical protein [Rufibacter glacialis]KAA6437996.1 hypothetical protein FOE74_00870 [Rufibacter glacialis]GGK89657.1 hypothetical protein GCM10011405_41700 [Rufibacter glacialis]